MASESQEPPGRPPANNYPASLDIDFVGVDRSRLTVFFRIVTSIPIMTLLYGLTVVVLPVLLMILFRQKYPRWWFDFNLELTKFSTRTTAYMGLLTDTYPATDDDQGVHLTLDYPDAQALNRWLPLIKWILLIPHYIVLAVLGFVWMVLMFFGWLVILFTGNFPHGIHNYSVGVTRWSLRVQAYGFLLTTDKYPPFSLD